MPFPNHPNNASTLNQPQTHTHARTSVQLGDRSEAVFHDDFRHWLAGTMPHTQQTHISAAFDFGAQRIEVTEHRLAECAVSFFVEMRYTAKSERT